MTADSGSSADATALYEQWRPTISGAARRRAPFAKNGLSIEDLEQCASLAFFASLDRWDRTHPGHQAWMHRVINTAIGDALRSQQSVVRLPPRVWSLRSQVVKARVALTHQLSRDPTPSEIAQEVGVAPETVVEVQAKAAVAQSLNETNSDGSDAIRELADPESWELADKIAIRIERQQHVAQILAGLSHPAAEVVRLKWGLGPGSEELSNKEIAQRLGKSNEWVRLRLREAERHIRHVGLDRTRRRDLKLTAKDVEALLSTNDLAWYDLTGADLRLVALPGADFTSANLEHADLARAELPHANLARAKLRSAALQKADLTRAKLTDSDLSGADLREANLVGADLSGADLREANLGQAQLVNADLRGANLTEAILTKANLSNVVLWRPILTEADRNDPRRFGAVLTAVVLTADDPQRTNLIGAKLDGITLSRRTA